MARPRKELTINDLNEVLPDEDGLVTDEIKESAHNTNPIERVNHLINGKKNKKEPDKYIFELVGDFKIDNHGKTMYPKVSIDNVDMIIDPDTGEPRTMRLLSGVNTVWMDEQKNIEEKQAGRMAPQNMTFIDGKIEIPAWDKTRLFFFLNNNKNGSNPNRKPGVQVIYKLVNSDIVESDELSRAQKEYTAVQAAMLAKHEDMIAHAKFLGIRFKNDYGIDRTDEGIRVEYIKKAKQNPDIFLKTIGSPTVRVNYWVRVAIEKNIITLTNIKGEAHWNDTKTLICKIPQDRDNIEYLTEFCFTEEGKPFYETLKTKML